MNEKQGGKSDNTLAIYKNYYYYTSHHSYSIFSFSFFFSFIFIIIYRKRKAMATKQTHCFSFLLFLFIYLMNLQFLEIFRSLFISLVLVSSFFIYENKHCTSSFSASASASASSTSTWPHVTALLPLSLARLLMWHNYFSLVLFIYLLVLY